MSDPGTRFADKKQEEIEKRIHSIYREATADIVKRLDEHSRKLYANDAKKRQQVKTGELSKDDYKEWLRRQMYIEKIWNDQIDSATEVLLHANQAAVNIVNGERKAVFAENANYTAYAMEKEARMDLSFKLYDDASVTRLLRDEPQLLPPKKVDEGKDVAWNREKISAVIARGIISGSDIPTIARNIGTETGSSNEKAMTRYARTAMTGAQNAGRIQMLNDAQEMGIQVRKVWMATLDERTRPAHQDLDGQSAEVNEPFSSMLGPIMYPGDPSADEANTWCCRCTLTYDYKEYPKQNATRYDQEDGETIEDMTYNEWLEKKHPERIKQEPKKEEPKLKYQQYERDKYDQAYEEFLKVFKATSDAEKKAQADVGNTRNEWFRLRREGAPEADVEAAQKAYEEAKKRLYEASGKMAQAMKEFEKYGIEATVENAQKFGISYLPVRASEKPFDQQAVISRVAGGDKTDGSCASLGFCYVAQKAGYDVLDFRGGNSQGVFAGNCVGILKCLQSDGISTVVGTARSYVTAGKRALEKAVEGKEYYFVCGRHATIIRRVDGNLEYLELQSGRRNGWMPFDENVGRTLSWRFGTPKTSGYDVESYMLDVDEMAKSDRLLKIMGYINTNEDEQKKGKGGYEK